MKNKLPYSVPEGYFENLESRVTENISRRPGLSQRLAPAMAIAASMLILLGIGSLIVGNHRIPAAQTALTEDEIIEYLIDSRAPLAYFDETF